MEAENWTPIPDGQFTDAIARLHENAIRAALKEVDFFAAIGDIDEDARLMLRQGIAATLRQEAMHYTGDANFTRRTLPRDGQYEETLEALWRNEAGRREHRIEIALHNLQKEWRDQMPS